MRRKPSLWRFSCRSNHHAGVVALSQNLTLGAYGELALLQATSRMLSAWQSAADVEAAFQRASDGTRPQDSDLYPVYNYLEPTFPSKDHASASSSSSATVSTSHWYCAKTTDRLYRQAATYLIFLFAFKRDGMPKKWLEALEGVLRGCEGCARAFGAARRNFASK